MKKVKLVTILLMVCSFIYFYYEDEINNLIDEYMPNSFSISAITSYSGKEYITINNDEPEFTSSELKDYSYEKYSELDSLGRAGSAIANLGIDLMPTTERGSIGNIRPTGWHTVKYDIVNGKYLYNRCHLIGYQLSGENANEKNLITCTRQMNTGIMLDYENKVAEYIKETYNHVLYRVTPIYEGNNLLAKGVEMEGYSVEDNGEGIKFHIFVYNVQDGINIDYKTGDSYLEENE